MGHTNKMHAYKAGANQWDLDALVAATLALIRKGSMLVQTNSIDPHTWGWCISPDFTRTAHEVQHPMRQA